MTNKVAFSGSQINDVHYRELKKLVHDRLRSLPPRQVVFMRIRAVFLMMLYILVYSLALTQIDNVLLFFGLYAMMGILIVLIFLNVIHEAIHGTLFNNGILNYLSFSFLDLIGANSYIFRKRHVNLHHNFANVDGWDSDIEQAYFIRVFPHADQKSMHRVQHWTFSFLYPVYLVNWVFIRDFKDYFSKRQVVRKVCRDIPVLQFVRLFAFKFFFLFYTIGIPVFFGISLLQAIAALLSMLIVAGTFALLVLLTPHVNVKNEFPLPENDNKIAGGWFMHQLNTTNDIACDNWITRNVMGNFNCHLTHHLFPHINYVYAPQITDVIRDYATKHNLNYRSYPITDALKYHYHLLKKNASPIELFEDDM